MLIALTVSLSAQAASLKRIDSGPNLDKQLFDYYCQVEMYEFLVIQNKMHRIGNLPNPVIQAINNALRNYTLHTGDVFIAQVNFQQTSATTATYHVCLRITDARNSSYEYYAWRF